jgi:hypothetical protein
MAYKPGEIYFVREKLRGESTPSPYIKIGLVALDRTSDERLKQHQTGNPRRLYNEHVVKTDAVHRVEAVLHKLFAVDRVSGEWFDFSDEATYKAAVDKAKSLAEEMRVLVPLFEEVAGLDLLPSAGEELEESPEAEALAREYAVAQAKLSSCEILKKQIRDRFSKAIDEGVDTKGAASKTKVEPAPDFNVTVLKKHEKELYDAYAEDVFTWSSEFSLWPKKFLDVSLDSAFLESYRAIEIAIASIEDITDSYQLVEPELALTNLTVLAQWDSDFAEARLKKMCGEHPGIKGAVTWVRKYKPRKKFNEAKFADEQTEKWLEYTLPRKSYDRLNITKNKS